MAEDFIELPVYELKKKYLELVQTAIRKSEEQFYQESVLDFKEANTLPEDTEEDYDEYDSHCCSMNATASGCCEICGAVIPGSSLYRDLYGCD